MGGLDQRHTDQYTEHRYLALVRLGSSLSFVTDWAQLAEVVVGIFGEAVRGVRVWAALTDGYEDMARYPPDLGLEPRHVRELRRASVSPDPTIGERECLLVGLRSVGRPVGVLEFVLDSTVDVELAVQAAPVVASRASMLLAMGVGGFAAPSAPGDDAEIGAATGVFAAQAKEVLEHDRLSAYLVVLDGRAVERFAVATSETLSDEGIIVPFSEFGLRHVLIQNRALVSADLGLDERIVGREDRVIAKAGYRGLLSVPLRVDGVPFGVLNFVSRSAGFYSDRDVPIAQQIADQAAAFFVVLRRHRSARAWTTHSVTEHERARLARELHDTLARAIPQVSEDARALAAKVTAVDAELGGLLKAVADDVDLIVTDTRRALVNLAPPALDSQRLEEVIQYELDRLEQTKDVRTTLVVTGGTQSLSLTTRRAVYRIAQEGINNVRLHAGASRVDVHLAVGRDLLLLIEDDGGGFVPAEASRGHGLGLRLIAERARSLGGSFDVRSRPGGGAFLRFELPGVEAATEMPDIVPDPSRLSAPSGVRLRIYVIEPVPLLLAGTVQALRQQAGVRVVGATPGGSDVHAHISRQRPDVVLLDIDHDPGVARSLLNEISLASPTSTVIVTTQRPGSGGGQFIEQGAHGIASKRLPASEFFAAILRVLDGGRPGPLPGSRRSDAQISGRECEMLKLIASGRTNAEIADELFLARKTIERNVATLAGKLKARNRAHAAALAVASGLITLAPEE